MNKQERSKLFLEELTQLSKKHRIAVNGCGCCGSPYLSDIPEELIDEYDAESGLDYKLSKNLSSSINAIMDL